MKGQILLIICLLFAIGLVMLRNSITFEEIFYGEKKLKNIYLRKYYGNIVNEMEKAFKISALSKRYEQNFEIFSKYLKNSVEFELIAFEFNFPLVQANQQIQFNATVFNLLGRNVVNLTLTFNYDNSTKFIQLLEDGSSFKTSFSFNISSDQIFEMNITYYDPFKKEKVVELPIEIGKEKFIYNFEILFPNGRFEEISGEI